jgi:hypothetical protein
MNNSRREFLKQAGIGGLLTLTPLSLSTCLSERKQVKQDPLLKSSYTLLKTWCDALLQFQIHKPDQPGLHGGLMCPGCARIHGRSGDAIYPLLYLAKVTGEGRYLDGALKLYTWMEHNVSRPDGAWVNDVNVSGWDGITVFTAISLAEAIHHHGDVLSPEQRQIWFSRLKKAANFLHSHFHIDYSNINYPISGAYALTLLGELFQDERYKQHGKQLAREALAFISPNDQLLVGEAGGDRYGISPKGCYPIDLGYNVEESLPALVQYVLLTGDEVVKNEVIGMLLSHMEFMLPDGAWDNSWGTRSYKWTYWGSRTSDGCQPAYALLTNENPVFYQVAELNLQLLRRCTVNGLLQNGLHSSLQGVELCIHHTFCHTKSLTAILDRSEQVVFPDRDKTIKNIPRVMTYGTKYIKDIDTWLVSTNAWKATITGYDKEYKIRNGHPTGGALAMLWHRQAGPILVSSMNEYQLLEAPNMQHYLQGDVMPLTMRVETEDGKYMSCSDLDAKIECKKENSDIHFTIHAKLKDGDQKDPTGGAVSCLLNYHFIKDVVKINAIWDQTEANNIHLIVPLVASSKEKIQMLTPYEIHMSKEQGRLIVSSNVRMNPWGVHSEEDRIYNHVPGMQAFPIALKGKAVKVEFKVEKD